MSVQQSNPIARISDFTTNGFPSQFEVQVSRKENQLSVRLTKEFFGKRFEVDYDAKTKNLTFTHITDPNADGVKVGKNEAPGGRTYYCMNFGTKKWVPDMPIIKSPAVKVKFAYASESFTINIAAFIENDVAPIQPIEMPGVGEINQMNRQQAAKCVQYLNDFVLSDKGTGFEFVVQGNKLSLKKIETIE